MNELIVPAKDPIGKKLLRLMGWREGHGVGSNRVKLQKKPNSNPVSLALYLIDLI